MYLYISSGTGWDGMGFFFFGGGGVEKTRPRPLTSSEQRKLTLDRLVHTRQDICHPNFSVIYFVVTFTSLN